MAYIVRGYSDLFFNHMEKILTEKARAAGKIPVDGGRKNARALDGLIPRAHRARGNAYSSVPILSDICVVNLTAHSATITWKTDKFADGTLWYDVSDPLAFLSGTPHVSSSALVADHDFTVAGLKPDTTYYYMVASSDLGGNTRASTQLSFKTLAN